MIPKPLPSGLEFLCNSPKKINSSGERVQRRRASLLNDPLANRNEHIVPCPFQAITDERHKRLRGLLETLEGRGKLAGVPAAHDLLDPLQAALQPTDGLGSLAGVLHDGGNAAGTGVAVRCCPAGGAGAAAGQLLQSVESGCGQLLGRFGGLLGGASDLTHGAGSGAAVSDDGRLRRASGAEDIGDGLGDTVGQRGHIGQHASHSLQSRQERGEDVGHGLSELLLDVAQGVFQLLDPTRGRGRQSLIHAADAGRDDLSQGGGTLCLVAVLQHGRLGLGEGIAVAAERAGLTVHHLAHHGGNVDGILCRGIVAVLLGDHVVHDGDQSLQRLFLRQVCSKLLGAGDLHVGFDDAEALLRLGQVLDAGDVGSPGTHGISHDLRQAGLGRCCLIIGGLGVLGRVDNGADRQRHAQGTHDTLQATHGGLHQAAAASHALLHGLHRLLGALRLLCNGRKVRAGTHHQVFHNGHISPPPRRRIVC